MRTTWIAILAGSVTLSVFLAQVPAQQTGKKGKQDRPMIPAGDWPLYSRDYASTRFSPLAQINTRNVAQLTQAWTYSMRRDGPPPPADNAKGKGKGGGGTASEATPIVVNGVMYVPAGNRIVALDAESGKEAWRYTLATGQVANRALGYWPGDGTNPPHIIFTSGRNMMALNANTGNIDPGFGKEGLVDISIPWSGAPYVYKNLVILGASNGELTVGPPGDTR